MNNERQEFREVTGWTLEQARSLQPGDGVQAAKWQAVIKWLDAITALEETQRHIAAIASDIETGRRTRDGELLIAARQLQGQIEAATHNARLSCVAHDPGARNYIERSTYAIAGALEQNDNKPLREAAMTWLMREWQARIDAAEAMQARGDLQAAHEVLHRAAAFTEAMRALLHAPVDDCGPVEYAAHTAVIMERASRADT